MIRPAARMPRDGRGSSPARECLQRINRRVRGTAIREMGIENQAVQVILALSRSYETRRGTRDMTKRNRIPLAVKLAYTVFVAILVPNYWLAYSPWTFLYFCDVALLLTLPALWLESPLLLSYVHGLSYGRPQNALPPVVWLTSMIVGFPLVFYVPAHLMFRRFVLPPAESSAPVGTVAASPERSLA
jgi:hypothetical protein